MQVIVVIGLVVLILAASTVTVVAQDQHARQRAAKRQKARLTQLGEPTPRLPSLAQARRHWPMK